MEQIEIEKIIDDFIKKTNLIVTKLDTTNLLTYESSNFDIINLLSFLQSSELRFTILTDLFAADFPERSKRFEIVYNLLSLKLNLRVLVKLQCEENEKPFSITSLFSASAWYEREVYDMFGVEFENHPDMRRILTDYGFIGHPLRKDFPLSGHAQVKYDEKLKRVVYEPILLEQEFRNFDFCSPWSGPDYPLAGDEKATK